MTHYIKELHLSSLKYLGIQITWLGLMPGNRPQYKCLVCFCFFFKLSVTFIFWYKSLYSSVAELNLEFSNNSDELVLLSTEEITGLIKSKIAAVTHHERDSNGIYFSRL